MRSSLLVVAALALAAPAIAQMPTLGTSDPSKVIAGNYKMGTQTHANRVNDQLPGCEPF
jgi:hypothetical protein